jgi:hypothetical protein
MMRGQGRDRQQTVEDGGRDEGMYETRIRWNEKYRDQNVTDKR